MRTAPARVSRGRSSLSHMRGSSDAVGIAPVRVVHAAALRVARLLLRHLGLRQVVERNVLLLRRIGCLLLVVAVPIGHGSLSRGEGGCVKNRLRAHAMATGVPCISRRSTRCSDESWPLVCAASRARMVTDR